MVQLVLSDIVVYPVKSLNGLHVKSASVEEKGLALDRRWMLIDGEGRFLTQRQHPELVFFKIINNGEGFEISHRNKPGQITIPYRLTEGIKTEVTIWKDTVQAVLGEHGWGEWLSEILGFECNIVYIPTVADRPIKKQWSINGETVGFADAYPYLVVGQASLNDLNKKLDAPIDMARFRPNLVFEGGKPYEEFTWKEFMVGNNRFVGLKPCQRCVMITIDQETGKKGKEPLKTLLKQKIDNKIVFGQHAVAMDHGVINIGDQIKLISSKDSPHDPL